jgi:glycosyltransferase 2 family protein
MKRLRPLAILVGLVLLILILRKVDLHASFDLLKTVQWSWLSLGILFIFSEIAFKAARFQVLVRHLGSRITFRDATDVYLSGQPLSTLTPSKVGDIARVLGLSRWAKLSLPSALSVHVADKVFDLLALGLLACVGILDLINNAGKQATATAILLGILLGVLLMALFLHPGWMRSIVKPVLMALAPKKLATQLQAHGAEFYQQLQNLFNPSERVAVPFILSILAWESCVVRAYFCSLSLSMTLTLTSLALLLPVVIVIEFIPISILGFGLREWALIFFFSDQAPKSSLISLSFLLVLTSPIAPALMGIPAAMRLGETAFRKNS